jgi:hypothetical protein
MNLQKVKARLRLSLRVLYLISFVTGFAVSLIFKGKYRTQLTKVLAISILTTILFFSYSIREIPITTFFQNHWAQWIVLILSTSLSLQILFRNPSNSTILRSSVGITFIFSFSIFLDIIFYEIEWVNLIHFVNNYFSLIILLLNLLSLFNLRPGNP